MRSSTVSGRRGAARHVFMGCGIALVVILVVFGVGGFWAWKKFGSKISVGQFNAQAKADPAPTAGPDEVLPPAVAGFTRQEVESTIPAQLRSVSGNNATSGVLSALYTKGDETVTVTAIPTSEVENNQQGPGGQQKLEAGQGMHMRMGFGPEPIDMVMWSNHNWTYMVTTTSTQPLALPFAEQFEPGQGGDQNPRAADQPAGEVSEPAQQ